MTCRRFLLLVNPVSGDRSGPRWATQAESKLRETQAEVETVILQRAGQATEIVSRLQPGEFDGLCVFGGDGSVQDVVNGLRQGESLAETPLGLIATGTSNSLHCDLNVEQPRQGIERVLAGCTRQVDLLKVSLDGHALYCVHLVGWAAVAEIAGRADRMRWLGQGRYKAAAFLEIFRAKRHAAQISFDGQMLNGQFAFLLGCNTQFVGSGMHMAPQASLSDGLVDLFLIEKATRWQMLQLFTRVQKGTHVELPFVTSRQVKQFAITTEEACQVNLDGDVPSALYRQIEVEVIPNGMTVFA